MPRITSYNVCYTKLLRLSLAGIYQPRKDSKITSIPMALEQFLADNPHIKSIKLHLDNDIPGREAIKALMVALQKDFEVVDEPPTKGKDCNDQLKALVGIET